MRYFGPAMWSEDGELSNKTIPEYLRWYPEFGAYFIDHMVDKKAEVVTPQQLAEGVNNGTYDLDDDMEDRETNGGVYLLTHKSPRKDKKEPPRIPSGMYRIIISNQLGIGLAPYSPDFDSYVDLHTHTQMIQSDIETFLTKETEYKKLGLLYRRGLLLYGPPGTGKSLLIEHLCAKYSQDVRILLVPAGLSVRYLSALRNCLNDMVTFFIFEEITSIVDGGESEVSALLNFLDGAQAWNRSVVIATTNYPENLPGNIVDRPSRFDRLYKIDYPVESVRRTYLEAKLGKEVVTDELVAETKGFSIAHLRELVVSIPIYGQDPQERLREIKDIKKRVKKEFAEEKKKAGFGDYMD